MSRFFRFMPTHRILGILLVAAASACSADDETEPCTTQFVYGLKVTVTGGTAQGCNLTVTASDGGFVQKLDCTATAATCTCLGAGERPGTYRVELMSQGKVIASQQVGVGRDRCHVITEALSFTLPE